MTERVTQHVVLFSKNDHSIAHASARALELDGFKVVPDGESALNLAQRSRPELLLTDWLMPRLDGLTLCRQFRNDPSLLDVPIILASSLPCPSGEKVRWDLYLRKPVNVKILSSAISTFVENASAPSVLQTGRPISTIVDKAIGDMQERLA